MPHLKCLSSDRLAVQRRLLTLSLVIGVWLVFGNSVVGQEARPRAVARLVSTISDVPALDFPASADARKPASATGALPSVAGALPSFAHASPIERQAFEITNSVRLANGLALLTWDAELCRLARIHSENMARAGFFSHETPDGFRLKERARGAGIHFRVIAENIAYNQGYEDPGAFAVERWMSSGKHRENILEKVFQSSAVGVFVDSEGCVYLTQLFIQR